MRREATTGRFASARSPRSPGSRAVLESCSSTETCGNSRARGTWRPQKQGVLQSPTRGSAPWRWNWGEFRILRFHEPEASFGYDTFDGGRLLVGTLVTQLGEEIDGVIRWDADEAASWEMLNGRADDVDFTIEFGNVSRIERGEAFGATVTLLDGRTFELDGRTFEADGRTFPLGDSNDVSWDNKGDPHPAGGCRRW